MKAYEDAGESIHNCAPIRQNDPVPECRKEKRTCISHAAVLHTVKSSLVDRYLREGEIAFDGEIGSLRDEMRPEYRARAADPV